MLPEVKGWHRCGTLKAKVLISRSRFCCCWSRFCCRRSHNLRSGPSRPSQSPTSLLQSCSGCLVLLLLPCWVSESFFFFFFWESLPCWCWVAAATEKWLNSQVRTWGSYQVWNWVMGVRIKFIKLLLLLYLLRICGFALCWAFTDQSCTDFIIIFIIFFIFRICGFLFSVYWAFFLVGLPVTFFFFWGQILVQIFCFFFFVLAWK